MRSTLFALTVFILTSLFPYQCNAWNAVGHMVIANIAYERLQPQARTKVDKLVADLEKEYPTIKGFDHLGKWADDLRGQKIETYSHWHYIDNAFSDDGTPLKDLIDTDNIVWAINHIETVVKNNNANSYERARFLAFLIHFVGDVHQPLHTVTRITKAHPNGDRGGNAFIIQRDAHGIQSTNLHSYWDDGLGLFGTNITPKNIETLAHDITKTYPEKVFGAQINDLNAHNWAGEGVQLATTVVYKTAENQVPTAEYNQNGKAVAEQRIALAGYRLAALLNQLLIDL